MTPRLSLCTVGVLIPTVCPLWLWAANPTPAREPAEISAVVLPGESISAGEIRGLLAKLSELQSKQDAADRLAQQEALKALTLAVVGNTESMNLYVSSVRVVEFDKLGKKYAEFEEWKKKNDERLHDAGFTAALRLQYRYMKLALESDTEARQTKAAPTLIALADDCIKAIPQLGVYARVVSEDPFASPVALRFAVEKRKPEGWPASPLHLGGVHALLMKVARATAPKQLPQLWEARIKQERALAIAREELAKSQARRQTEPFGKKVKPGKTEAEIESEKFDKITLPKLQWEMGEDLFNSGLRRRGIEGLFNVLMKNPDHPSRADWLKALAEKASSVGAETGDTPAADPVAPLPDSAPVVVPAAAAVAKPAK